jgi:Tfp pilus assembly protein PilW
MLIKTCSITKLLFAITLLFVACKKGDTGPEGPPGPQGPKGDSATANIIYSPWLDVTYSADTLHVGSVIDTIGFYANVTATKLSSTIISGGEIKIYMNLGTAASPDVVSLPYIDVFTGVSVSPEFLVQKIFLYANTNASTVTKSGAKYLQYRYILVPGVVPARKSTQPDWNNYNQVKTYYHLND